MMALDPDGERKAREFGRAMAARQKEMLVKQGFDPDDEEVKKIVAIASTVIFRVEREHHDYITQRIHEHAWRHGRKASLALTLAGGLALAATLYLNFDRFIQSVRSIDVQPLEALHKGTLPGPDLAQLLNAPLLQTAAYGAYVLLAIGYFATLSAVVLRKDPMRRAGAMAAFKSINAFFIGALLANSVWTL